MIYGVALGSNLGDRLGNFRQAVREILHRTPEATLIEAAPVYETAPVDCADDTPSFYNTVIEVSTKATPHELLDILQQIEVDLGRPKEHAFHVPRTIDLDLLYGEGLTLHGARLTLPHPRIRERHFVLQPLTDIRPALTLTSDSQSVAQWLADLGPAEIPLRLVCKDWSEA